MSLVLFGVLKFLGKKGETLDEKKSALLGDIRKKQSSVPICV